MCYSVAEINRILLVQEAQKHFVNRLKRNIQFVWLYLSWIIKLPSSEPLTAEWKGERGRWSVGQLPYRNILCVTRFNGLRKFLFCFRLFFCYFFLPHDQYLHNINLDVCIMFLSPAFFSPLVCCYNFFFRLFRKEKVQLSAEGRAREMETKSLGYTPRRIIMCKQKRGGEKEKKKSCY